MRQRFLWKKVYAASSVWPREKPWIPRINDNMFWQVGSGKSVAFWRDKWLSKPILEI